MYVITYNQSISRERKMVTYRIITTEEYDEWVEKETEKSIRQINKRLEKIKG